MQGNQDRACLSPTLHVTRVLTGWSPVWPPGRASCRARLRWATSPTPSHATLTAVHGQFADSGYIPQSTAAAAPGKSRHGSEPGRTPVGIAARTIDASQPSAAFQPRCRFTYDGSAARVTRGSGVRAVQYPPEDAEWRSSCWSGWEADAAGRSGCARPDIGT